MYFLGSKATETTATVNGFEDAVRVIIDSGSDITLISQDALAALGPVKIAVEAYVVKDMSTPLILGNDFATQYSLSILRDDATLQILTHPATAEASDTQRRSQGITTGGHTTGKFMFGTSYC
ncbi:hypothetical protein K435DRAFT_811723 [Dendrothele bispora CBS 962.96]|uniref:Peptidase A2 domain-containing protein n=1 Tax=Dendrothele bispora (strain CBS 962.96) TaxID=1314807 RepID=A0A4S8KR61_DENBC|nr:hypothetical protein K435DRAFT_811723 [Dendrothele bispora CBS 962.96]